MDFISWLVIGVLFMLAEFGVGSFYLLAIGLACIYPSITAYTGAPTGTQLAAAGLGAMVHALIVLILRKLRPAPICFCSI
jgi:membrane protein implicated in regulation of membrane protease activity